MAQNRVDDSNTFQRAYTSSVLQQTSTTAQFFPLASNSTYTYQQATPKKGDIATNIAHA